MFFNDAGFTTTTRWQRLPWRRDDTSSTMPTRINVIVVPSRAPEPAHFVCARLREPYWPRPDDGLRARRARSRSEAARASAPPEAPFLVVFRRERGLERGRPALLARGRRHHGKRQATKRPPPPSDQGRVPIRS